jgi:uncharacterized repeat protein (TIGR01451 family)
MKKIFNLTFPIGMLLLLFVLFHISQRASGAATSAQIGVEEQNAIEQDGTPWFDAAWNYRQPVVINSSVSIPWYQVLIVLNSGNFNFSHARSDGWDIRFTHSDGETELNYWIESWDYSHQLAYVWVKIPGLANGDTTIYLYYNNPIASSQSNGPGTFDSFDDNWSQFLNMRFNQVDEQSPEDPKDVESPFTWTEISGSPSVSNNHLILDGAGIKSTTSSYLYQAVGYRAIFGSGAGHEWVGFIDGASGKQTRIGDNPDKNNIFLMNFVDASNNIPIPRVGAKDWHNEFHVYEIRWWDDLSTQPSVHKSMGDIDHGASSVSASSQVPGTSLPVTLFSETAGATLTVDWIYVRQYRNPEPTVILGDEQGLVELGISNIDSPDPLLANAELSYLLTISNYSLIDVSGVVVTDTLPGSVQFVRANPPQGCSHIASNVVCSLNTIAANSTASVTIVVNPTVDGVITNTATVGSPGYELDLISNTSQAVTLVAVPPTVEWVKPVENRQTYVSFGGPITLEAFAFDNDQIGKVEFWRYDGTWVNIQTVFASPYQYTFSSDILNPTKQYPFEVYAFDRAGNQNSLDPDNRQVIYIERKLPVFLPIMIK